MVSFQIRNKGRVGRFCLFFWFSRDCAQIICTPGKSTVNAEFYKNVLDRLCKWIDNAPAHFHDDGPSNISRENGPSVWPYTPDVSQFISGSGDWRWSSGGIMLAPLKRFKEPRPRSLKTLLKPTSRGPWGKSDDRVVQRVMADYSEQKICSRHFFRSLRNALHVRIPTRPIPLVGNGVHYAVPRYGSAIDSRRRAQMASRPPTASAGRVWPRFSRRRVTISRNGENPYSGRRRLAAASVTRPRKTLLSSLRTAAALSVPVVRVPAITFPGSPARRPRPRPSFSCVLRPDDLRATSRLGDSINVVSHGYGTTAYWERREGGGGGGRGVGVGVRTVGGQGKWDQNFFFFLIKIFRRFAH